MNNMRFCLLLIFSCVISIGHCKVLINEVMQGNVDVIMDDLNQFPDSWVELYNNDSTDISIAGYSIGEDKNFSNSYPLPDSSIIKAKGFYLIYCDKESKGNHTNFKIEAEDASILYLFDNTGKIIDHIDIPSMAAPNISYGRINDGNDTLAHFKIATPSAPNCGYHGENLLASPIFSVLGGIYTSPLVLHIGIPAHSPADAIIRYTTDGTVPTVSDSVAPDSISIYDSKVIRAAVFSDSAISSPAVTQSYLYLDHVPSLPIISISIDTSYLYDKEIGIYTDGTYYTNHPNIAPDVTFGTQNFDYNWWRPANIEFFDNKKKNSSINQLCEIRIGGNFSRQQFDYKSLIINAGKKFGAKRISYPFWNDKPNIKKCKSIFLRNSGQDLVSSFMRDALMQTTFGRQVDIDWQSYQPAIVMVDGQYWGLLNIRERSNEDFIWENYNKLENIDLVDFANDKASSNEDLTEWDKFHQLYSDSTSSYSQLDSVMDVNEFLNWFSLNCIFWNVDFPGNNVSLWKEKKEGAKWRWIAKDMDSAWGLNNQDNFHYLNFILRVEPFDNFGDAGYSNLNTKEACRLFQKMVSFPCVKEKFIDRMCIYMGTFASADNTSKLIDSLAKNIEYEMPYFVGRMGRSMTDWRNSISVMKTWINEKEPFTVFDMKNIFSLGDTLTLTISGTKTDSLYFNNINLYQHKFDGKYFVGRDIYLSRKYSSDSFPLSQAVIVDCTNKMDNNEQNMISIGSADSSVVYDSSAVNWTIQYTIKNCKTTIYFTDKNLHYIIPDSANDVIIIDKYQKELKSTKAAQDTISTETQSIKNQRTDGFYDIDEYRCYDIDGYLIYDGNDLSILKKRFGCHVYIVEELQQGEVKKIYKTIGLR